MAPSAPTELVDVIAKHRFNSGSRPHPACWCGFRLHEDDTGQLGPAIASHLADEVIELLAPEDMLAGLTKDEVFETFLTHRFQGGSFPWACKCGTVLPDSTEFDGNLSDLVAIHQADELWGIIVFRNVR